MVIDGGMGLFPNAASPYGRNYGHGVAGQATASRPGSTLMQVVAALPSLFSSIRAAAREQPTSTTRLSDTFSTRRVSRVDINHV